jgi:MFS family permease
MTAFVARLASGVVPRAFRAKRAGTIAMPQPQSHYDPPSGRTFYGWYVAYALCLVATTAAGLAFYNISVLLDAFVTERGFPVTVASVATGLFFIGAGIGGVLAGHLIDRIDARLVVIASACVCALALGCVGLLREPWHLYAFYLLFGFAFGGCGLVPISTIVARWFNVRRPQALAIASTGLSLGGVVLTPLSALAIKQLGLAGAAPWLGLAFFLGIVPATALIVRAHPHAMGLAPDGAEARRGDEPAALPGVPFSAAWRTRYYAAVTGAYVFALGAQVGGIAHLYRLASTRADDQIAAVAVALFAGVSLAGRLASGWLLMKASLRSFALALMAGQAIALALLGYAASGPAILVATALFGIGSGTILMMQQLLLADAFGTREYGRIYSVSMLLGVVGVASGPALVGMISTSAGGYAAAFLTIAGASLLGGAIMALGGAPRR